MASCRGTALGWNEAKAEETTWTRKSKTAFRANARWDAAAVARATKTSQPTAATRYGGPTPGAVARGDVPGGPGPTSQTPTAQAR